MYCSAFVCEAPILLELFHLRYGKMKPWIEPIIVEKNVSHGINLSRTSFPLHMSSQEEKKRKDLMASVYSQDNEQSSL